MSEIYYVFIVLPIIIMGLFSFVFQSSVNAIADQEFLINCPYPIYEGVAEDVTITNVYVTYTIQHDKDINGNVTTNDQSKVGTEFECTVTSGLYGVTTSTREYGATLFNTINYGYTGYLSDAITQFFAKAQAQIIKLYLIYDAPAQVTQLEWWSYVNYVLTAFIGLGIFMMVRGN